MSGPRLLMVLAAGLAVAGCGPGGRQATSTPSPVPVPPDSIVVPAAAGDSMPLPTAPAARPLVNEVGKGAPAERPGERCILDLENTVETRMQSIKDPISGRYTTYIGGGVVGICRGQDIRITSDSAESYDQNGLHYLIGNVKYREKRVSLDSDRLTYFKSDEHVLVEGNVHAVMPDSSSMDGPRAEYFRAVRRIRTASRLVATGRPTLRTFETDSLGQRQKDPVIVIADQIVGEGDTLFNAFGRVEMNRVDLSARGDSAVMNKVRQFSRLMKEPTVESKGSDPFTLAGRVIDIFGRSRQVERVLAIDSARAVSRDLTLASDTLDLRVRGTALERAFAFGRRASAVTALRNIVAESLDVRLPGQVIRELHAVRGAYAETIPDTLRIASTERDWLRGDTIVARFDSLPPGDTTKAPDLRELLASGNASSFYQLPDNKGRRDRPGLNYVRGRQVKVDFGTGQVQQVTVRDQAAGIFLEAGPDSATAKPKPALRSPAATKRPPAPSR